MPAMKAGLVTVGTVAHLTVKPAIVQRIKLAMKARARLAQALLRGFLVLHSVSPPFNALCAAARCKAYNQAYCASDTKR
jgi:hypothetical protein